MKENSTIAAIATALSPAGISIIRISGPQAFDVIDRIYRTKKEVESIKKGAFAAAVSSSAKKLSNAPTHTIHYGYICDENEVIDEVMVSIMKGPRSFTAEDTVEINCHGGILVTRRVLDCVFKNGAAPAQPGEFTKRAFLNGRIDLSQAEAVMELISAKNRFAIDASLEQLSGKIKLKSPSIICSSRVSLVVPAISVTIALCLPDNALSKDDFPAFGFPTITVRIPSVKTFPLSKESAIFFTAALIF